MTSLFDLFSIHTIIWHFNLGAGYDMSYIEAIGTLFGLTNIWLAAKEKYLNFYFGLVNVVLFGLIFYQIQLYANLLLQIFFFIMNLYGLYSWRNLSNQDNLKIHWLGRKLIILIGLISITAIIGLSIYINQIFVILTNIATQILNLFDKSIHLPNLELDQHPIIDSTILVLSIVAMILMTRKAVENWLIWCLINLLSIWLYATQNVYLMSIEYVILLLIAIKGSIDWINKAKDKH